MYTYCTTQTCCNLHAYCSSFPHRDARRALQPNGANGNSAMNPLCVHCVQSLAPLSVIGLLARRCAREGAPMAAGSVGSNDDDWLDRYASTATLVYSRYLPYLTAGYSRTHCVSPTPHSPRGTCSASCGTNGPKSQGARCHYWHRALLPNSKLGSRGGAARSRRSAGILLAPNRGCEACSLAGTSPALAAERRRRLLLFVEGFVAAASFEGARTGFAFKTGSMGLGYYPDDSGQRQVPIVVFPLIC
jgi:hypothetical protein